MCHAPINLLVRINTVDGVARAYHDADGIGIIEFWVYKESGDSDLEIRLKEEHDPDEAFKFIFGNDGNIYIGSKDFEHVIKREIFYEDAWYHVKINYTSERKTFKEQFVDFEINAEIRIET